MSRRLQPRHFMWSFLTLAVILTFFSRNSRNQLKDLKFKTAWPFPVEKQNVEDNCYRNNLLHANYVLPLDTDFLLKSKDKLQILLRRIGRKDELRLHVPLILPLSAMTIHSPSGKKIPFCDLRASINEPGQRFPSAVHFILPFRRPELIFIHYVSILSAFWMIQPKRLILWYVRPPKGMYWHKLKKNLTDSGVFEERVVFIRRKAPRKVYEVTLKVIEHQSDVMRMDALLLFGGLYLDLDVIVVRPLRKIIQASGKKEFVIGREFSNGLGNGVMLAAPNAVFLALWHLEYQALDDRRWNGHSVFLPHLMAKTWPHLVHVENFSMERPNWFEKETILNVRKNGRPPVWRWWDINFCVHLWFREYNGVMTEEKAKTEDSMLAELIRWVLFGQKPKHAQDIAAKSEAPFMFGPSDTPVDNLFP